MSGYTLAYAMLLITSARLARRGGHPLIALELLRRKPVVFAFASQAANRATYLGLLFVLARYLQHGPGASAVHSGLAVVPWVAAFGVAEPVLASLMLVLAATALLAGVLAHLAVRRVAGARLPV